jgi:hypothetical protein
MLTLSPPTTTGVSSEIAIVMPAVRRGTSLSHAYAKDLSAAWLDG